MGARVEERNVQVGAGDTQLVAAQMKRQRLIISTPKVATVWITLRGTAAVGKGIAIRPGTGTLVLDDAHFGRALTFELRAISDGVAETIGVWDFFH